MGKRTNPPGLRSGYLQSNHAELSAPSFRNSYRHGSRAELVEAFSSTLEKNNLGVIWVSVNYRGFFWKVHVFSSGALSPLSLVLTRRRLGNSFWGRLRIRHHDITSWLKDSRKRRGSLRGSLGRVKRHKSNRFFFRTAAFLQLGISALSPELISKVVCSLLRKHNRHWLVFRFIKVALNFYYRRFRPFEGLRLQVAGKINGRSRKRRRIIRFGPMPLQGIANDVGYSYRVAVTKFGAFGIKLWLLRHQSNNNDN